MTLYRQLLIFSFTILCFLLAGIWFIKLNSTKSFLIDQLESHAQDTATSLGLSISTHFKIKMMDTPAMEAMVDAIFDRGYYQQIVLKDLHGDTLINRKTAVKLEHIPHWFTELIPLTTPNTTAQIMDGWQQVGSIEVMSHPGYAYQALWDSGISTALWFGFAFAGIIILGGIGLRIILKPLALVEKQALAICKKQYITQKNLPRTRELFRVVSAMNQMTEKVQALFAEQTKIADQLRKKAYIDPLTGVGNRRYLKGQVDSRISRKKQPAGGCLLMIHINSLEITNRQHGYTKGDKLISTAAELMAQHSASIENAVLARLNGADFALLLPAIDRHSAKKTAQTISQLLQQLMHDQQVQENNPAVIGGYYYHKAIDFPHLLAGADEALRQAQSLGRGAVVIREMNTEQPTIPSGKAHWLTLLQDALAEKRFALYAQPTVRSTDTEKTLYVEILSRLQETSGTEHRAGMFVPLAERTQQIHKLDKIIIEKVLSNPFLLTQQARVAINLSPISLVNSEFYSWLLTTLEQRLRTTELPLNFEFSENMLPQYQQCIKSFTDKVQSMGHFVGIDHFGKGFLQFGYLKSLRPNYVKIDRAFTNELTDRDSDSYFFINSLCNVAHSLDILIIAEGVESKEQLALLQEINLDAYQGYFFKHPYRLES